MTKKDYLLIVAAINACAKEVEAVMDADGITRRWVNECDLVTELNIRLQDDNEHFDPAEFRFAIRRGPYITTS